MRIALAQLSLEIAVEENVKKACNAIEEAAGHGCDVICFPEVQFSPFFPQFPGRDVTGYLIAIDHPIVERLRRKCRDLGIVCVPNFYQREGDWRFDASPVIDTDGAILGISKMVHIVRTPCFYEQDYYTPADTGFHVYDTTAGAIGVVICFDRHFPESIRTCVLKGAQIIIIPTANTKSEPLELFEWEMRVSAVQSGVFIAMCNRVGVEGEMDFAGESLVVDPSGAVIAKADDRAQLLLADLDLAMVERCRQSRPYLALRRPEYYAR